MAQDDRFGTKRYGSEPRQTHLPLAQEVISILNERQTVTTAGARQVAVDYLVRAITGRTSFDAALVLEEMSAYRLTHDALIDLYIPQAAAQLGELWMTSDMNFAQVTVGALRLQALLGEAAMGLTHAHVDEHTLHGLIVVPEGEQHFLGASVVAAQMRRMGCDVGLSISESPKQVMGRVLYDQPDVILFSCAHPPTLETIKRTVKKIKASVDPVPVLAFGGALRGNADGIRDQTGVDLVTNTAKDVVGFAMKRKKALGRS